MARSGAVIATSQEIADRFRRRSPSITVVAPVHEVVAPRADRAAVRAEHGATGPLIVAVGRLHEQKGLDVLVRALALVAERRPGVLALLAGDGPERATLDGLVADLGVGASVRLLGARETTPRT